MDWRTFIDTQLKNVPDGAVFRVDRKVVDPKDAKAIFRDGADTSNVVMQPYERWYFIPEPMTKDAQSLCFVDLLVSKPGYSDESTNEVEALTEQTQTAERVVSETGKKP